MSGMHARFCNPPTPPDGTLHCFMDGDIALTCTCVCMVEREEYAQGAWQALRYKMRGRATVFAVVHTDAAGVDAMQSVCALGNAYREHDHTLLDVACAFGRLVLVEDAMGVRFNDEIQGGAMSIPDDPSRNLKQSATGCELSVTVYKPM